MFASILSAKLCFPKSLQESYLEFINSKNFERNPFFCKNFKISFRVDVICLKFLQGIRISLPLL